MRIPTSLRTLSAAPMVVALFTLGGMGGTLVADFLSPPPAVAFSGCEDDECEKGKNCVPNVDGSTSCDVIAKGRCKTRGCWLTPPRHGGLSRLLGSLRYLAGLKYAPARSAAAPPGSSCSRCGCGWTHARSFAPRDLCRPVRAISSCRPPLSRHPDLAHYHERVGVAGSSAAYFSHPSHGRHPERIPA